MNAVSIPGSEELEVLSPSCIEIVQCGSADTLYCIYLLGLTSRNCDPLKEIRSRQPWIDPLLTFDTLGNALTRLWRSLEANLSRLPSAASKEVTLSWTFTSAPHRANAMVTLYTIPFLSSSD
ncbi:hypothetical protein AVEN_56693-1 [Araneus ventricosus]|uniref:Uncharacterized protein n=1 Tax=Araneus ventricosus TaxID=182803 RepID=A0A4Y2U1I5_ARAVE|nr:hypothetical protein AVEN_56693-1 [Araneus ventricosus]